MLMPTRDAVTEFSEASALPRVQPAAARALNRLYGSPPPLDLMARGVAHRLRWTFGDAARGHDAYRFRLGSHGGHLSLDAPSIEAVLGERRTELLPRDLRYILLAEALHAVADTLEKALRLRFEWQPQEEDAPPDRCDPQHAAFFATEASDGAAGLRGYVQFDDAAALDALLPAFRPVPAAVSETLERLRLPLGFSLGVTRIQLREVLGIRAGDIIGIDEWSSAGPALVVTAELGGPAGLQLTGLAEGSRITLQQTKGSPMNRDAKAPSTEGGDAAGLPIDRLDALEVTLRFEVGDLSLSLGELKNIRAGHVFDLGQPLNRSPVRIFVHGNVLGKGHLVAVGDRLGVRVSEFAPGEIRN